MAKENTQQRRLLTECPGCRAVNPWQNSLLKNWWVTEREKKLYEDYIKAYRGRLTYAYCPSCREKRQGEIKNETRKS